MRWRGRRFDENGEKFGFGRFSPFADDSRATLLAGFRLVYTYGGPR
jgi:hypothetical protein